MSSEERHFESLCPSLFIFGMEFTCLPFSISQHVLPEKAEALAFDLLNELIEKVKVGPCAVIFASFSGGPKSCIYEVLQIIEGICEAKVNPRMSAPYLILCSENDDLAPYQVIHKFAQ